MSRMVGSTLSEQLTAAWHYAAARYEYEQGAARWTAALTHQQYAARLARDARYNYCASYGYATTD